MDKIALGIFAVVLVVAGFLYLASKNAPKKPKSAEDKPAPETLVLGQQLADALAQEKKRQEAGQSGSSPLPSGSYERRKGEWGLLTITPVDFDQDLQTSCRAFATLGPEERAEFRSRVSMDEFYTLIQFARRCAVLGIRSRDAAMIHDGLTALAIIEAKRTDPRDLLAAIALLHHSIGRVGMDPLSEFEKAAHLSEPNVATLFVDFTQRTTKEKDLQSSWLLEEVETDAGIGFVNRGLANYSPETDLLGVALRLAPLIEKDAYYVDHIEMAADLPRIWLEGSEREQLDRLLEKVTGGIHLSCSLAGDRHPQAIMQQFTVFLVELVSENAAQSLLAIARAERPKHFASLGVASGRIFVLVVARSFAEGVESFESGNSLTRFERDFEQVLQERP